MVFPITGGTQSTGYDIENSVRFNDDDSAALSITPSSASTSRTKWTWSGWVKRGEVPTDDNNDYSRIFNVKADGNNYIISGFLYSSGFNVTAREGNTEVLKFEPSRKFRDHSAWYHIVMAYDSTQGTARNRFRVYFNGEEDTTALATTPDQNTELVVLEDVIHNIGRDNHGTAYYYDGYMADVYLIDGTQYAASDFGETDDNGVWIPKEFTGTFGTNGFKLEFQQTGTSQNSSGIGADTSGNDNHLAVTNLAATDVTTDTPTNNFITVTPLGGVDSSSRFTFTEGNTVITQADNGNWRGTGSTIALTSGKWYWEVQNAASASTNFRCFIGVIDANIDINNTTSYDLPAASLWYNWNNGEINTDGTYTTADYGGGSSGSPIAQGDTLGVLLNMDDNEVSFFKNGSALVEGFSLSTNISTAMPFFASGESADTFKINFGNPAHSISSTQADDNGYGNFEYDVPAGYYAICTKNLAEYG